MNATTTTNDRDETISRIRNALKNRSGRAWSVRGGRGTAWGWIDIDTTPAREAAGLGDSDRKELAGLLGMDMVCSGGVSVPASMDHRREFIDRAEGRTPAKIAEPYWD